MFERIKKEYNNIKKMKKRGDCVLSPTHRLIAKHVQENIAQLSGVEIEQKFFRYGTIAPDLHPHLFFGMHHYREDSQEFVCRLMRKIIETKWTQKNRYRQSYLLGLICHFTSDYSCYPHVYNEKFADNFRAHFRYEVQIHRKLKHFSNLELELQPIVNPMTEIAFYRQRMQDYETVYHTTPHSQEKDIRFAIGISSMLLSELLLANQKKYQ